jgi:hypothetical protein
VLPGMGGETILFEDRRRIRRSLHSAALRSR